MADEDHPYIPAGEEDSRSSCPALNALANHGYIPHDGRNLTLAQLVNALRDVYNVSNPIATGLTLGGLVLCGRRKPGLTLARELDLHDLARHNVIEHDGSLVHADAASPADKFAPTAVEPALLRQLLDINIPRDPASGSDSDDECGGDEQKDDPGPSPSSSATSSPVSKTFAGAGGRGAPSLTLHDLCRFQLQRHAPHVTRPLDTLHARFATGEVALLYEVLSVAPSDPHAAPPAPPPARAWRSSSEARRASSVEEFAGEVDVAFKLQLDAQAQLHPVAHTLPSPSPSPEKPKSMRRRLRDSVGSSFAEKGQIPKKVAIDGDRRGRAHARGYSRDRDTTGHPDANTEAALSAEEGEEGARVVPKRFLEQWLGEERLPEGWARPAQELGFPALHMRTDEIRKVQAAILAAGLDDGGRLAKD